MIVAILKFLRGHVFTCETLYLDYLRKSIRHFNTSHSSAHEGTNHGLKSHCAALNPRMDMDTSAKTLNIQQDLKAAEIEEMIYFDFTHTDKRWSKLPTSPYTVSLAEGLLLKMMSRIQLYESSFVGDGKFQVKYMGDEIGTAKVDSEHYSDFTDTPIPLFRRIRIVTIQDDGTMLCDCYQFEREGIPCAHQGCVATMCYQCCGKGFVGFTYHDISVHWCCAYMHMAYKKTTPPQMQKLFHHLVINDICGPKLGIALPNELVQHDSQTKYPAHERVKNYHGK